MTNPRILFLVCTAIAALLLFCGCSPQQEKLGPCPNEFESHTPIYDRDTILFHYEAFDHEAIDEIPPTPEGSDGGPLVTLWALVGTVEGFDAAGIAKIKVDANQSSDFILDTVYLNANAPIEGGGAIAVGDKIECRFLHDSRSEIIDPEKSGYIRILDSEPAELAS